MPRIVLLSPWRGGTPRRLCNALDMYSRTPDQYELDKKKHKISLIVNWGCSRVLGYTPKCLNFPSRVAVAANKLSCIRLLTEKGIKTLEYTVKPQEALEWLKKGSVVAHWDLHGHSASGLDLIKKGEKSLGDKKYRLFTKYFRKTTECRVHCIKVGDVWRNFFLLKKRILADRYAEFGLKEAPNTYIRTWDNGWIFAREVADDQRAIALANETMEALGLQYGAVDIMYSGNEYVVGEVNTAPGLEGECLAFYVEHLGNLIQRQV